jgi:hypothetical protein
MVLALMTPLWRPEMSAGLCEKQSLAAFGKNADLAGVTRASRDSTPNRTTSPGEARSTAHDSPSTSDVRFERTEEMARRDDQRTRPGFYQQEERLRR